MALSAGYVTRETAGNLRRNAGMTAAAVIAMAVSLTALGGVLIMRQAINKASVQWRGGVEMAIFLNPTVTVNETSAIQAELSRWFADPGRFEHLRRSPLPDGELVEFTLTWEEHGVPHACHQAHILRLRDGRVAADTAFCGGRWPAPLLAEMDQASRL